MGDFLVAEHIADLASVEAEKVNPDSGVKSYPILDFDSEDLEQLSQGIHETLRYSKVKVNKSLISAIFKRAFDIAAALFGLALSGIPILIFALIIFLQDGGNPFFSQFRLTKNGKPFKMYKLRSMCINAEELFEKEQKNNETDGLAFKAEDDSRITKIGHFIRRTSIDELPQFVNVLKGDMSIIGPRPPLPREVVLYTPHHMDRFLVKGGLACIAQAEGRSEVEFEAWIDSDIRYIESQSFFGDIALCFKILHAIITRKGTK